MAISQINRIVEHLRHTVLARDGANLSDGQLLDCFVARREESAFEILVRRHGPMVLSVCRRVVGNHHDAEDAFQATFLVLVRKAASIQPRELVGNWLYGVAYQTALRAKTIAAKRGARERQVTHMPEAKAVPQGVWLDLQPLLDQELSRLSDKYRVPIVLCDLEGKTRKEAAQLLGVPEGTISSRLARARTMLAKRLTRHGVTVSAGALAAVLSQQAATAHVPATLVCGTLKAAGAFAAGGIVSAKIALLTEGVLKAMLISKLKSATALLVILGIMVLSYVVAAGGPGDANDGNPAAKVEEKQQGAERKPMTDKEKLQGRWKVVSGEKYGEKLSADDLLPIAAEIVFAGDKLSIAAGDGKLRPFKIDPKKKPKEIDFYMGEGFVPAICELDGNTLKICIPQADPSDPPGVNIFIGRPKLMSGTGPLRYVIQFERVTRPELMQERQKFVGSWRLVSLERDGKKASEKEVEEVLRVKRKWLADNEGRKLNSNPLTEPRMQFLVSFDSEGNWKQETQGDATFTFLNCEGTSTIDSAKKPRTIDCTVTRSGNLHAVQNEGEKKGQIKRGIYEFVDEDTYRIRFAAPGKERPADFTAKEDSGHHVWVMKLVKKADAPVLREIDLKGYRGELPKNDFTKPTKITSAQELAKAFPERDVGIPVKEWREKIAGQVDFTKQDLLFFAWSGSGGDRILTRGEKTKQVVFRRQPGVTTDLIAHFHLYAISKEATWSIETGVSPAKQ
jgi:RNA polymerase sigma factor (sigma-70 family)